MRKESVVDISRAWIMVQTGACGCGSGESRVALLGEGSRLAILLALTELVQAFSTVLVVVASVPQAAALAIRHRCFPKVCFLLGVDFMEVSSVSE